MTARFSFLFKAGGALLLVILADLLFWLQRGGSTIGLFMLALLMLTGCLRTEIFRSWPSRLAFAAALFFALVLAADPGPLALLLYWTSLTLAVLLTRTAGFDDGLRWAVRLFMHGLFAPFGPLRDLLLAQKAKRRRGASISIVRVLVILIVPAIGSVVFLTLFAQANPLIEQALARIDLNLAPSAELIIRAIFWGFIFVAIWSLLRPGRFTLWQVPPDFAVEPLPRIGLASITISLIAFNAIFGLQNGLDIAFLWTGAHLPDGMTYAGYAHRGAYPLIATAILAALFVLVALSPKSPAAASRPVRWLVTLWIGQNVLLVASTMLRTFNYIEAYSLTELRIAALIWMALVGVGLVLVCYRLLRAKSAAWLINANLLAAFLTLAACTTFDMGRMSAAWNVRHAREVGGSGVQLDLCYLNWIGPGALLPLIELESRPIPAELRFRAGWVRSRIIDRLEPNQADWHGWTLRNQLRLDAARRLIAERRLPHIPDDGRQCDGRRYVPPPIFVPTTVTEAPGNDSAPAENGTEAKPLPARPTR